MTHPTMPPIIVTCAGDEFNFAQPESSVIDIEHIAHALSHLCRFTGHTRDYYSVAQHSVCVSLLVPPQHALAGLLHDAAEAYVGDMATPLKRMLPDYQAIEARVHAAVMRRFGLPADLPDEVHHADLRMLASERRDLMPAGTQWDCLLGVEPGYAQRIEPWGMRTAQVAFLRRYRALTS